MQGRRPPRIRCSSVWVYLLFYFLSFTFFIISPNSQPSSLREKGPFASLARLPASTPTDLIPCHSVANLIFYSFPAFKPIHCAGWVISFYLPFIDAGLIKERAVAMGKPHCNRSIRTFLVMPSLPWSTLHGILFLFLLPCLCFCFFRAIPWQMLFLILPSVVNPFVLLNSAYYLNEQ